MHNGQFDNGKVLKVYFNTSTVSNLCVFLYEYECQMANARANVLHLCSFVFSY